MSSSKREGGGGVLGVRKQGGRYASFTTFAWPVVHQVRGQTLATTNGWSESCLFGSDITSASQHTHLPGQILSATQVVSIPHSLSDSNSERRVFI